MDSNPDALRGKLWDAYFKLQEEVIYVNSANPIEIYVKEPGKDPVKRYYDSMTLLGLTTAITPMGSIIYVGGHGNSKTALAKALGVMVGGLTEKDVEEAILRIHPELTEEKVIARPDIGKLVKQGTEEYVIRNWVKHKWKVADEINRAPGEVINMLLSGVGEGVWRYADMIYKCEDQRLFATLNPYGEGTFDLAPPMLDRFDLAVPALPADSADFAEIGERKDASLYGMNLKPIMSFEEVKAATKQADEVRIDPDARLQMRYFSKEISLCDKAGGDKSLTELRPSAGLCTGCHYATDIKLTADGIKNPCQMFDEHVSTRSYEKWTRSAKRLAWLLGQPTVTVEVAAALQPYMFYHRVEPNEVILNKHPFNGNRLKFLHKAWELSQTKLDSRTEAEEIYLLLLEGKGIEKNLQRLGQMDDLIVKYDLLPHVQGMVHPDYKSKAERIASAKAQEIDGLQKEVRGMTYLSMGVQNELRAAIRSRCKELEGASKEERKAAAAEKR